MDLKCSKFRDNRASIFKVQIVGLKKEPIPINLFCYNFSVAWTKFYNYLPLISKMEMFYPTSFSLFEHHLSCTFEML